MANRLANAVSPYLRSHADNPVDWQPWGIDAFAEAVARDVPVLISIGYSTCHWCHVMARESFSDPALAAYLNEHFVSIKVDREEHPDVDASYLAAASAFTDQLGWPLTVFATPTGRAFYAGTYFPPTPTSGLPSFREVLEAMVDAWADRRADVEDTAGRLAAGLTTAAVASESTALPTDAVFVSVIEDLLQFEDHEFGGFGSAPKFPVAPVIGFLLDRADAGDDRAATLASRTLAAMASSSLRDPVDGGFFRYATRRDWSDPHYERMLYDNALLLDSYARASESGAVDGNALDSSTAEATAVGLAQFLLTVLRLPSGGFASAQDSESMVDGQRVEGGYYLLTPDERSREIPPALDDKVLTGWNGLAIGALAAAGNRLRHPEWIAAAVAAADLVSAEGSREGSREGSQQGSPEGSSHDLVRARIGDRVSTAKPTLEDYGMLAAGLVELAVATGEVRFAARARELVEAAMAASNSETGVSASVFGAPGGVDPVLAANGLALENDPSEGAYPSGLSAMAHAALRLGQLGVPGMTDAATRALEPIVQLAVERPISFGSALGAMSQLARPLRQLVVVTDDPEHPLAALARRWRGGAVAVVTPEQARRFAAAGFELFDGRDQLQSDCGSQPTAYFCEEFVCRLPVTSPADLEAVLS